MLEESTRFDSIKNNKPLAISAFNLFQTPAPIADKMLSLCGSLAGKTLLEPSAGLGRIIKPALNSGAIVTAVENSADCAGYLYDNFNNIKLIQKDFLIVDFADKFDFIVMNPPFKMGIDIKHINHALKFLKKGGKLITLCANGPRQNKQLKPLCDYWEVLPDNSFKKEGTSANISLGVFMK